MLCLWVTNTVTPSTYKGELCVWKKAIQIRHFVVDFSQENNAK